MFKTFSKYIKLKFEVDINIPSCKERVEKTKYPGLKNQNKSVTKQGNC